MSTTVRVIERPMGPGRATLRLALRLNEEGEPAELLVCAGFGEGALFHRPSWGGSMISIPGDAVHEVRDALCRLLDGSAADEGAG